MNLTDMLVEERQIKRKMYCVKVTQDNTWTCLEEMSPNQVIAEKTLCDWCGGKGEDWDVDTDEDGNDCSRCDYGMYTNWHNLTLCWECIRKIPRKPEDPPTETTIYGQGEVPF